MILTRCDYSEQQRTRTRAFRKILHCNVSNDIKNTRKMKSTSSVKKMLKSEMNKARRANGEIKANIAWNEPTNYNYLT